MYLPICICWLAAHFSEMSYGEALRPALAEKSKHQRDTLAFCMVWPHLHGSHCSSMKLNVLSFLRGSIPSEDQYKVPCYVQIGSMPLKRHIEISLGSRPCIGQLP